MSVMPVPSARSACLAELRRRIGLIERGRFNAGTTGKAELVVGERATSGSGLVDPLLLGGGGAEPALHELVADGYGSLPSVRDFSLALVTSLLHRRREQPDQTESRSMVLWCQRQRDALEFGHPYGPGLRSLGLPPDRLLMVTGRREADCLWAMEQGLASRSLLAVVGMADRVSLTASRRLSLAARAHGTWCLLLPLQHGREPSAARTRWRIEAAPSLPDALDPKGLGLPCWQLALERSPSGRIGRWTVEWDHATHHFHLAAARRGCLDKNTGYGDQGRQVTKIIAFDRTG
ncbi:MAG: ImuA family protein [Geminicoccaceae bacterium]